jgi:hypothetical protein
MATEEVRGMKLARFAVPLAIVGLLASSSAAPAKTKPARVFVNVVAEQVWISAPNNPFFQEPFRMASVHVKLTAYDVDPTPSTCTGCQTADIGTLEVTKIDPNDPRHVIEFTREINAVWVVAPGRATVDVDDEMWSFVDGGSPGNEAVGPALPTGLDTTRDGYSWTSMSSPRFRVWGSVVGGTVDIG